MDEKLKNKLDLLPNKPGSYQMLNKEGNIIYIGKAKDLKKRVNSYFNRNLDGKTKVLVSEIADLNYIVTSSELEALILEINLIKKNNPKYNILLKDDKSYPYIELRKDKGPLLKVVRNLKRQRKKSLLFGPYPNVRAARKTVDILNRLYPLRKCDPLRKNLCLYYHLSECLGYCEKDIDDDAVDIMIRELSSFLNGNSKDILKKLEVDMHKASAKLDYEKALDLKETIDSINLTLAKQVIELPNYNNFDLFNYYRNNNYISIYIFYIREGKVFGSSNDIIASFDDDADLLMEYIIKYYDTKSLISKELIVPKIVDAQLLEDYLKVKVSTPSRGKIKKLLDLARSNARIQLEEKEETISRKDTRRMQAIDELNKIFNADIKRIEAFDNSHLFGTFYVSAMVVFDYFLANKNAYRKFRISADVKDDVSAMKEAIYRRYHRLLMNGEQISDLLLVDGGAAQVNAAKEVIDSLNMDIIILGLKKDTKHRTSALIDVNLKEIKIVKDSSLFLYLSKIQEEVHRYTINYHRQIKTKGMFHSLMDSVPGIGEVRKKQLLREFSSVKKLKEASFDDLSKIIGEKTAKNLIERLKELK